MTKKIDILGKFVSCLIVFFVLFQPVLFSFNILHFLSVISMVCLVFLRKELANYVKKQYLGFLLLNVLFLIYIAFVAIFSGTIMFGLYGAFLYAVELQVCVFFAFVLCKKTKVQVQNAIIIASFVQALIALAAIVIPQIQEAIINLYIKNGFPNTTSWFLGKRFFGLSSQLTFTMPVAQVIIAVFCIDCICKKKNWFLCVMAIAAIVFSAMINARIAIVVLLVGGLYLLITKRQCLKMPVYYYLIALCVVGGACVTIWLVSPTTFDWVFHGVKDIASLFTGERIEGSYFSALFSQFIFFPEDLKGLFLGKGINVFTGAVLEQRSDVGYIIDLWYAGVLGCMLKYLPCVCSLGALGRKNYFAWFLLAVIAIVNIKGIAVENNELMAFVSLFILNASYDQGCINEGQDICQSVNS